MIRVLIVDDHRLFRRGLQVVLREAPDIEIVGEAATAADAIRGAARLRPDVVTLDLSLPDRDGLDAIADILKAHPQAGVLALTVHEDEDRVRDTLARGAVGYVVKNIEPDALIEAIRSVAQGLGYLSPGVVPRIARAFSDAVPKAALHDLHARGLSDREIEILLLLRRGFTDRQIADAIHRAPGTVKTHLHNLFHKLRVRNRAAAAALAASLRLG